MFLLFCILGNEKNEWLKENREISFEQVKAEFERHLDEFVTAPEWVGKSLRKAAQNPPVVHYSDRQSKKPVTLREVNVFFEAKAALNEKTQSSVAISF